jgi:spore maturation protein CgeB
VSEAALVIVGSFVPDGARVGEWVTSVARGVTAFYDIDTPVTLAQLAEGQRGYVTPDLIRRYGMYLSFTGGPLLRVIETDYGSPMARPLYCSVDTDMYVPHPGPARWDLGYLGTYSDDRQPTLDELLLRPAREWAPGRFAVVGPKYPEQIDWPSNVTRTIHLSPREHPVFYGAQRFTLNITRPAMKQAGYSPSVRLFEAGACGTPIVSDWWEGLDTLFQPGKEVLLAFTAEDTLRVLRDCPEADRLALGEAARRRILAEHTPELRAAQLERYLKEVHDNVSSDPTRADRRGRPNDHGLEAGLAPERGWPAPGGGPLEEAGADSDSGHLHKPVGASN